jgi:hypothetical protein
MHCLHFSQVCLCLSSSLSSILYCPLPDVYLFADPTATSTSATTVFEPVLNVPALIIFLVITLVFGFLQLRVAAIGSAVDRRTQALQKLRTIKTQQLSGELHITNDFNEQNNDSDDGGKNTAAANALVETAMEEYRAALEEVERLRTIIPGFARIAPPPAPTAVMEENMAAAKQFLGIDLESRSLLPTRERETEADEKAKQNERRLSSPVLVAILVVVGISQIGLLFLLSLDPMMPSSNVFP